MTMAQIIAILQQAEKGETTIQALCKEHGITETTFYRWRKVYGGMSVSEASRLKELEKENAPHRRARPGPGCAAGVPAIKVADKAERATLLQILQQCGLSQRAFCGYLGLHRAPVRYMPRPDRSADLLAALVAYAHKRRCGYHKAWSALRRRGHHVSKNRVHRLWKRAKLQVKKQWARNASHRAIRRRACSALSEPLVKRPRPD